MLCLAAIVAVAMAPQASSFTPVTRCRFCFSVDKGPAQVPYLKQKRQWRAVRSPENEVDTRHPSPTEAPVFEPSDDKEKFVVSIALGAMTGVGVALFKLSTANIQSFAYKEYLENVFQSLPLSASDSTLSSSLVVASIPVIGGLAVSALNNLGGAPGANLKSITSSGGVPALSARAQFVRAAAASATLGTGNSLGPEGPSVEIGASIASKVADFYPVRDGKYRDLFIACGSSAGVAAGFEAPIAAVFFALEVIQPLQRGGQESTFVSRGSITYVLLSSAVASLITRTILSERLSFKVAEYYLASPLVELPLYLGLGALAGVLALTYKSSAAYFTSAFDGTAPGCQFMQSFPPALKPALGGLACGAVGLYCPQVLFFGYSTLDSILADTSALSISYLAELCAVKLYLTAFCAASGLVGGTFAPSLFLGATAGAAYHSIVAVGVASAAGNLVDLQTSLDVVPGAWGILPQLQVAGAPAYAMVGAASVLAGLFNAPLTSSLLLFELTRDYDIILPLMASAGLASLIANQPVLPPLLPPQPGGQVLESSSLPANHNSSVLAGPQEPQ